MRVRVFLTVVLAVIPEVISAARTMTPLPSS